MSERCVSITSSSTVEHAHVGTQSPLFDQAHWLLVVRASQLTNPGGQLRKRVLAFELDIAHQNEPRKIDNELFMALSDGHTSHCIAT